MKREAAIISALMLFFAAEALAQADSPNGPARPDWITASNQPCKIWNPQPQPNESVTWSGQCKDGYATGRGVLMWTEDGKPDIEYDGVYANGKRNGPGVIILPDGKRIEGVWINDEPVQPDGGPI